MSKAILFLSFVSLIFLLIGGLLFPDNSLMWLASTTAAYTQLRVALIVTVAALLLTHPPRNIIFRIFVGAFSLFLTAWSLGATYQNQMQFLDTLSILGTSIAINLVVLERDIRLDDELTAGQIGRKIFSKLHAVIFKPTFRAGPPTH